MTDTLLHALRRALPLVAVIAAACGKGTEPPARGAPPPPPVGVVTVTPTAVPLATELPGRVEASRVAQVRARVTGIVQQRLFREGSDVRAGQPLFQIDPAPYRAALDSAEAALAKAQANLVQATALANRFRPLREARAISEQEYVNATAAQAQAQADVAAGRAAVQTAKLNLGHATVTAPIAGRIGRALVTEGALVSAAEATQLAVIQQIDPVYVNTTQPVAEVQRLRQALASGRARPVGDTTPVQVLLDGGTVLPHTGRLLFSDLAVDTTSGQVTLRALVPNPQQQLLPGMYVRARVAQARLDAAMLVPQQAVTRTAQGDTLFVLDAKNQPVQRPVRLGGAHGTQWIVLEGLQAGDRVVVDGFQKMRPGAPVTPVAWSASAPAGGTAGSAPARSAAASAPAGDAAASAPAGGAAASAPAPAGR